MRTLGSGRAGRMAALLVVLVLAAPVLTSGSVARTAPRDLVTNGGFDSGLEGWTTSTTTRPGRSAQSHSGSHAAVLAPALPGQDVVLDDSPSTVPSSAADGVYEVSAWVRAATPGLAGQVRVREVGAQGVVATVARSFVLADDAWTRVGFSFSPRGSQDSLDLSVLGWALGGSQRLLVDDVSLVRRDGEDAGRVEPSETAAATAPALSNGAATSARGVPARGAALVGAAVGGNTDPASFEREVGRGLGVRRTYWGPADVDRSVRTARDDLARGRLPWISFKLPYSWSDMADGRGDRWVTDLALRLSDLPGPVWVAFHHEPEGEGEIADWTRMQEHLGPILRAVAPNSAFTVILTGYHQLRGGDPRYALDRIWPRTEVDVAGFDVYDYYRTRAGDGTTVERPSDLTRSYFEPVGRWAAARGIAWGLAETGLSDDAARRRPGLLLETYDSLVANGGVVLTYFNSTYNSTSSWSITTPAKLEQFRSVVRAAPVFAKFV